MGSFPPWHARRVAGLPGGAVWTVRPTGRGLAVSCAAGVMQRTLRGMDDVGTPFPATLGRGRCMELLSGGGYGRIAVTEQALPVIVPVNYCLTGNEGELTGPSPVDRRRAPRLLPTSLTTKRPPPTAPPTSSTMPDTAPTASPAGAWRDPPAPFPCRRLRHLQAAPRRSPPRPRRFPRRRSAAPA
ncbi:pyridoxamine 5'-phosphate oxidase family protein [Streptomyces hydrogenans]|uniref:pyridoxamine 5'-phosphate oxidase family protein n=1 Tax=Streptomyces hydrogenans TaxID=1873719 RepID=UPI0035DBC162